MVIASSRALGAALAASLVLGTPALPQDGGPWEMIEAGEIATARVALPERAGKETGYLELSCVRGKPADRMMLSMSFRIPRQTSGLPAEQTTMDRRLGRQCRGPLMTSTGSSAPGKIVFHAATATLAADVDVHIGFVQGAAPIAKRPEPPCEIHTFALDPGQAQLSASQTSDTRMVPIVDLLGSSDSGEVAIEVAGRTERQRFPLAGAATAIARAKRFCRLP